jgi:predicted aconitase with swiveling domain
MAGELRALVPGKGAGDVLVLDEAISLWGGLDPGTGKIVDHRHPQRGSNVSGTILLIPSGRGSSSSSTVLAEAVRAGTAPAGIVLGRADPIIALGALVAAELYGISVPVVVVPEEEFGRLRTGDRATVVAGPSDTSVSLLRARRDAGP